MPGNNNSSTSQPPATADQDSCDLDGYSLFGDSVTDPIGVASVQPIATRDNRLPRITVIPRAESRQFVPDRQARRSAVMNDETRRTRLLSDESEPFSGGVCRQLAAMYTDVGMSTVERVRWLCGWMILLYALTCCVWFTWPAYPVPAVGILTGTAGLLACQRPHDQNYITYVLAFLALNYAQLALLVWMVFIVLPAEISSTCNENCAGAQTKAVFIVLLVFATGVFHWRVVTVTRHYVREFRMIEQLAIRGAQFYINDASYSSAAGSSTLVTDIQSRSSGSLVSVTVLADVDNHPTVPYADNHQETRL